MTPSPTTTSSPSEDPRAQELSLAGKVAIVTGASRGIGEAIARAFAAHGATVVLSSRTQETLDAVASSINEEQAGVGGGGRALAIACHAGKPDALEALFARVEDELGRIDVLVNNAATNPYFGAAIEAPEWAFDKTVEVNLKGYFLACQLAARRMVARGSGSIINIASILGIKPAPMQVIYAMTKAGVISLTKGLAQELGAKHVRVNAIAPGLIETQFASALIDNESMHRAHLRATPLGRHGQPNEIVGAALYLASEMSSFTTGAVMVCDGGFTA